ncbi:unnamed protein product [Coccothraustes coccothraustes]
MLPALPSAVGLGRPLAETKLALLRCRRRLLPLRRWQRGGDRGGSAADAAAAARGRTAYITRPTGRAAARGCGGGRVRPGHPDPAQPSTTRPGPAHPLPLRPRRAAEVVLGSLLDIRRPLTLGSGKGQRRVPVPEDSAELTALSVV